jgi:hypothetical protein
MSRKPLKQAAAKANKNNVPERAADPAKQSSRHLRPRTTEEFANEQTAEQLALRIWAAIIGEKALSSMSALMDELLQSHLLDDDHEEGDDEGWLDDHQKREKKFLDEAIVDGLDKYADINAINNLPLSSDPDLARDAEQLKSVLTKCAIGATEFKGKFPRAQLERLVKRDLKTGSRRIRNTASTCARTCRDWTPGHMALGVAPRPRGRSSKQLTMRAAAG